MYDYKNYTILKFLSSSSRVFGEYILKQRFVPFEMAQPHYSHVAE